MRQVSVLKVFADRIDRNLQKIYALGGKKKIIPMLKANAYGHDLSLVAEFIDKNYSDDRVNTLGVACLGEAEYLRKIVKVTKRIFVFSDCGLEDSNNHELIQDFGIIPVISNLQDLRISLESFKNFPLVLKFNTGMNRLGINITEIDEVVKLLNQYDKKELTHVMSHLGCSYLVNNSQNDKQLSEFQEILNQLKGSGISWEESSFFNSGAIEQGFKFDGLTHIRPGIMLYGPQSTMTKNSLWDGEIISNLETQVIDTRKVSSGDLVGYGATETPESGGMLILPLGYGDGLLPKLQNFSLPFQGGKGTFLGRINMDLATFWINDTEPEKYRGECFTLWDNNQNNFNTLVKHLGTHPYDVFCSITSRVPRKFLLKS